MNLCINILLFLRDEFLQRNADKKNEMKVAVFIEVL